MLQLGYDCLLTDCCDLPYVALVNCDTLTHAARVPIMFKTGHDLLKYYGYKDVHTFGRVVYVWNHGTNDTVIHNASKTAIADASAPVVVRFDDNENDESTETHFPTLFHALQDLEPEFFGEVFNGTSPDRLAAQADAKTVGELLDDADLTDDYR